METLSLKIINRNLYNFSIILCVWLAPTLSFGQTTWKQRAQEKGITVYSQKRRQWCGTTQRCFVSPFSVEDAAKVLMDVPNPITFIPFCKTIQLLGEEVMGPGRKRTLVYQVNGIPVVSDRDMVLEALTWAEHQDTRRVWNSKFKAVTDKGPPPQKGLVRLLQLQRQRFGLGSR